MGNKKVFMTGASGNMGWESFKRIYENRPDLDIAVLLRDSKKNRDLFAPYLGDKRVQICWGDFEQYEPILEGITGASYVLHIGGMISPAADYYPKKTFKVNQAAAENIVRAIKAQPNPDEITACNIGTVAQTGNRPPGIHWGRTGDPFKISVYDHYAQTKVNAERIFAESGLKKWVSLRQSGILYPNILKNMDPIMYHVPLVDVLEWSTVDDSAILMDRVCNDDIPDEFYRRFYNIGSGHEYRLTLYEFEDLLLWAIGMGRHAPKRLFKPTWFVNRNFHGQWYADSDVLEDYLHFRQNIPAEEYFRQMSKKVSWVYKLSAFTRIPGISHLAGAALGMIAKDKRFGTRAWAEASDVERLSAFYGDASGGGPEYFKTLSDKWEDWDLTPPSNDIAEADKYKLDHGYDETKDLTELTVKELQDAAKFRGGEYLDSKKPADIYAPSKWKCAFGHEFEMSLNTVLKGGHWCPECEPIPWNYDAIAKVNPFFAQVWYADHGKDEDNVFGWEIYRDYDEFQEK
ncbi:MAG: NAD(P)-dependent oxidoreductase [Ruminococcaceae bacterium]|nr:NAD(P)-dependent oxidoreductase [Oscillospiraceae bacterium]